MEDDTEEIGPIVGFVDEYADLIFPLIAIAFVATCIWLTVRIVNRRDRWAKWTLAAAVGVPVLYIASLGPASWYIARRPPIRGPTVPQIGYGFYQPHPCFDAVYLPIGWWAGREPRFIRPVVGWYVMVGAPEGSEVFLPSNREGVGSNAREGIGWRKPTPTTAPTPIPTY